MAGTWFADATPASNKCTLISGKNGGGAEHRMFLSLFTELILVCASGVHGYFGVLRQQARFGGMAGAGAQCLGAEGAPIRWRSCSSVRNMALQAERAAGAGAEARGQLRRWLWGCWKASEDPAGGMQTGSVRLSHAAQPASVLIQPRSLPRRLTCSRCPGAGSWPQIRSRMPAAPPPAASA